MIVWPAPGTQQRYSSPEDLSQQALSLVTMVLAHKALAVTSNTGGPQGCGVGSQPSDLRLCQLGEEPKLSQQLPVKGRSACGASEFQAVLQKRLPAQGVRLYQWSQKQLC